MNIKDKNILITGANRGIGKAIAETFLNQGAAKIYAAVRNPESVAPLIQGYGDRVVAVALDVSDTTSITSAAGLAGDVDIVINNGGVLTTTTVMDEKAYDSLAFEFDVNVYGLIRVAQAFAPILQRNGGGALIQLNSVVSVKTFSGFGTYSASKAASYSVTQSLRELLEPQGTQVISVHPGPIATDMGDAAGLSEIAEPATLVADSILEALESGSFHAFPDTMAKQIGSAYQSFAQNIVEANLMEG